MDKILVTNQYNAMTSGHQNPKSIYFLTSFRFQIISDFNLLENTNNYENENCHLILLES